MLQIVALLVKVFDFGSMVITLLTEWNAKRNRKAEQIAVTTTNTNTISSVNTGNIDELNKQLGYQDKGLK